MAMPDSAEAAVVAHFRRELQAARDTVDAFLQSDDALQACARAAALLTDAARHRRAIVACGNGGSMADAIHFAEELTGRYHAHRPAIRALALSDPGHLTCVANDYGFDHVFARGIEAHGEANGVLLALSTSGNSPNILAAAQAARTMGMHVVALTGKGGGALANLATVELRVPLATTAERIQEVHIKLIHALIAAMEKALFDIG